MSIRTLLHAAALTVLVGACSTIAPAADAPGAIVGVQPPVERNLSGDREGWIGREVAATFGFGPVNYAIRETYRYREEDPSQVHPGEGYIGMPAPTSQNWYHGGFFFIQINGRDVPIPASSMVTAETGDRAILDLVYHHEAANVRARFFGLPGEDWLGCEVELEPTDEITSIGVKLRCYPSYFTSHFKREGARRIQTPSTLVVQDTEAEGPLADHWWAVYYDEIFDVAKGEGAGPCAMLAVPVEGTTVHFDPGDYAVGTSMSFPPQTRTLRFAFWDLKDRTNDDALADIRAQADRVRGLLETIDPTPKAVTEFDVAAVRESLEAALASEETQEALGDRIDEVQRWLNETAPELERTDRAPGVAAQEDLLKSIDEYNSFKWEVKLLKLIHEL
ncbi:MAG: hypothetical protein GF393_11640 [Armatimonadia bacterium]|nr:hypothetical protein [Armatimonadia bacterium]